MRTAEIIESVVLSAEAYPAAFDLTSRPRERLEEMAEAGREVPPAR